MNQSIIALLTDFGTSDAYVGIMKGVILSRCPTVQIIDLTHEVAPQNIRQAAYLLGTAYQHFPAQTIFVVVVDPGVGTQRQAVAVRTTHGIFVAPDNGVLSEVVERETVFAAIRLPIAAESSHTFHGRDVFAPAAGLLANGAALRTLGTAADPLLRLPLLTGVDNGRTLQGEVIYCDRFGNLITNLGVFRWRGNVLALDRGDAAPLEMDAAALQIQLSGRRLLAVRQTYAAVQTGDLVALISSDGRLEIAVNGGSAAAQLGVGIGAEVTIDYA
jgi:hypothetical protein